MGRASEKVRPSDPMLGMLRASVRVREGRWLRGAPAHVLAEFLTELEKDGWRLHRPCPGCCNCAPSNLPSNFTDPMCDGSGER